MELLACLVIKKVDVNVVKITPDSIAICVKKDTITFQLVKVNS